MRPPRCVFCGRRPIDWHHLTGRPAPDAGYFDVGLVVPLCRRHHSREHVLLADRHLEWLPPGVGPVVHRLRRVRLFVERCADFHRPFVLNPSSAGALTLLLAEVLAVLADEPDRRAVA